MVSGARCSNARGSYKGEAPELWTGQSVSENVVVACVTWLGSMCFAHNEHGPVDDAIDPRGDAKVAGELGEVVPCPLKMYLCALTNVC